MDAVERNGYELIQHPDYSPDTAHRDFFLFLYMNKDILDVISGLTKKSRRQLRSGSVERKDPDIFSSRLMALEHRWSKCITLERNYIAKEEVDFNWK